MPRLLTKLFYSCQKVTFCQFSNLKETNEQIDQELVLKLTFKHPHLSHFLPSPTHCRSFLKTLITLLEGRGEEVLEEVYNIYVAYLAASEGLNEVTAAIANRSSKDRKKGDEEEDEGDYTYKAYYVRPRRVGASSVAQTSRIACDVNNNNNNNNDDKKKEKDDNFDDNNGGAGEEEEEEEEEEEDEERRWVKVRESNSLISRGTTGLSVWQASFHMLEWLVCHREVYEDKSIIELGAGTGLVGLVIRVLQQHSSINPTPPYVFTDHHKNVLNILNTNIRLNKAQATHSVTALDWKDRQASQSFRHHDVIIATDVVFDDSIIPDLVLTIKTLMTSPSSSSSSSSSPSIPAYLCSVIRNYDTWKCFELTCASEGLSVKEQSLSSSSSLFPYLSLPRQADFKVVKLGLL